MNIVLVRQGDKYGPEYVEVLRKQILKHTDANIYVLGDGKDANFKLTGVFKGWWAKLELFRPSLKYLRPFLYIDLDSFVLGDISSLKSDEFCMLREWMPGLEHQSQSSVMIIPKNVDHIWSKRHRYPNYRGDQDFLGEFDHKIIQDYFPDMVGSYKLHNKDKPIHKIVTFHGKPKQQDATGWAKDLWDTLNMKC